jgi:metal-responsive CopG/Arc/MetJ family transcriptional regulator
VQFLWYYFGGMKMKTSLSLSPDLLVDIDRASGGEPRSAFIERVLRAYLRRWERAQIDARDLELLDAAADDLSTEAMDALEYQVPI